MGAIVLRTAVPGPQGRALLERRAAATPAGLAKSTDIVVARAHGALVEDVDGNTFIDFAGGIGMLAVGHTPPSVVEAIRQQAGVMGHPCALVTTYEPYVRLCEVLNELTPGAFAKKTLLANSGAEAVENCVKLARAYTGRPAVICFEGGYHGRTLLTLSMTSKYGLFKKGFGPFAPEIYRLPAPDVYRRPDMLTEDQYIDQHIASLDRALVAQVDPSAVAAIVIEPIQGEAGFIQMPTRFLARIRELCDQHGIVMVADEVQSGCGRTGRMFAIEHSGVVPDLIAIAKSLGAGMPIAAITGRAEILDAAHLGGVGGTYGGNPVTCAAALAALEMIRQPAFLARATAIGERIRHTMNSWIDESTLIGDVRGAGAMMLIELVKDRATKEPAPQEALAAIKYAVAHGLVLIRAGLYSNCIRLLPPIVIEDAHLDEGLAVLGDAIRNIPSQH